MRVVATAQAVNGGKEWRGRGRKEGGGRKEGEGRRIDVGLNARRGL